MDYKENVTLYGEAAAAKIAAASDVLTLINYVKFGNMADLQAVYSDLGQILNVDETTTAPATSEAVTSAPASEATSAADSTAAPVSTATPSAATNNNQSTNAPDGIIVTK